MHQVRFRLGLRPRSCYGGLMPFFHPLTGFKGPTSNGRREEKGRGRDGKEIGKRRAGERGRWSPPPLFQIPGSATGGKGATIYIDVSHLLVRLMFRWQFVYQQSLRCCGSVPWRTQSCQMHLSVGINRQPLHIRWLYSLVSLCLRPKSLQYVIGKCNSFRRNKNCHNQTVTPILTQSNHVRKSIWNRFPVEKEIPRESRGDETKMKCNLPNLFPASDVQTKPTVCYIEKVCFRESTNSIPIYSRIWHKHV